MDASRGIHTNALEDAIQKIIYAIEYQRVQICFAHSRTNRSELAMSCDKRSKIDIIKMQRLESENEVTKLNVSLREGSTICMCFRGNISSVSNSSPNAPKLFRFYGIHGIHTAWTMDVVDRYAQRSLEHFCGFMQMYVWVDSSPFVSKHIDMLDTYRWKLLLEVPISLPKNHSIVTVKVKRAPVLVRENG